MDVLLAFAYPVAAVIGLLMLSDTIALTTNFKRAAVSSILLSFGLMGIAASAVAESLYLIVLLCRALMLTFLLVGAYHGRQTPEYDHLWMPIAWSPVYFVLEVLRFSAGNVG